MPLNSEVIFPQKMEFLILILVPFFATNSLDIEPVQLEETPLSPFDELFGEGWWDNDKAEEWHKLTLELNFHHQIDRQNTQNGQIEPNSTDQLGQIEPNSTDQNPPLTQSDHSDNAEDERKRNIIDKFHEMKDEFKQKGKYSKKEWIQIEDKIAKHLKVYRTKIFEWKKEFGLSQINTKKERKNLIEKFDQMKAELKRAGIKNSYPDQINESVAKKLGLSFKTIYKWKNELGQTAPKHKHSYNEQKELMKRYYEIKDKPPKIRDEDIAKMLNIGTSTLYKWKKQFKRHQFYPMYKWKKQFKRHQFYPNSVDGLSVEENAAANVKEIGNSNSGNIWMNVQ